MRIIWTRAKIMLRHMDDIELDRLEDYINDERKVREKE